GRKLALDLPLGQRVLAEADFEAERGPATLPRIHVAVETLVLLVGRLLLRRRAVVVAEVAVVAVAVVTVGERRRRNTHRQDHRCSGQKLTHFFISVFDDWASNRS